MISKAHDMSINLPVLQGSLASEVLEYLLCQGTLSVPLAKYIQVKNDETAPMFLICFVCLDKQTGYV